MLAGRACCIAICFEATRYHLKGLNLISTGMPLRSEIRRSKNESRRPKGEFNLLVMGGSGGAHAVNEMVSEAVCQLQSQRSTFKVRVSHLTGPADESHIRRRYEEAGVRADVYAFTQEMAALYEDADLAICRAGASTCAELGVFGLPALLIPYPYAASDHQTANAKALEHVGAADVVQESDMSVEWLADYIRAQVDDSERLRGMRKHALREESLNAAEKLAKTVERCAKK
jgi:UDP-N-acetylglucosamine--N-acetylmuramyl-(pentapeptide) pyrophosphoryl-undecaprenol N-acetylglucosamine transferase